MASDRSTGSAISFIRLELWSDCSVPEPQRQKRKRTDDSPKYELADLDLLCHGDIVVICSQDLYLCLEGDYFKFLRCRDEKEIFTRAAKFKVGELGGRKYEFQLQQIAGGDFSPPRYLAHWWNKLCLSEKPGYSVILCEPAFRARGSQADDNQAASFHIQTASGIWHHGKFWGLDEYSTVKINRDRSRITVTFLKCITKKAPLFSL